LIYNLRGTHGSGKSTIVQQLLNKHPSTPLGPGKRPLGYEIRVEGLLRPLYAVGPYATACGGCDAIQPYDTIWPRVLEYAKKGHVIFEGALISVSVGSIGLAMAARKDCVVLYLDTPIEVCLERIQARRAKKGDLRPLDPKNTISKHISTERTKPKMEALGVLCLTLKYKTAGKKLLEVLHNETS
jgi:shikimate kinase